MAAGAAVFRRVLTVAWSRNPAGSGYWVMKVGPGAETRAGETSTPPFERTGRRVCEAARQQNWPVFDLGIATKKNDDKLIFAAAVRFYRVISTTR
jgi:hypothetical protein